MFKVTNGNEFPFEAGFNGRVFKFPVGKTVVVPQDAAEHIFGIGDQNKTPYLARHGWVKVAGNIAEGMEILNKFKFQSVVPDLGAPMADDDHGPAPVVHETEGGMAVTDGATALPSATRGPGRPQSSARA